MDNKIIEKFEEELKNAKTDEEAKELVAKYNIDKLSEEEIKENFKPSENKELSDEQLTDVSGGSRKVGDSLYVTKTEHCLSFRCKEYDNCERRKNSYKHHMFMGFDLACDGCAKLKCEHCSYSVEIINPVYQCKKG